MAISGEKRRDFRGGWHWGALRSMLFFQPVDLDFHLAMKAFKFRGFHLPVFRNVKKLPVDCSALFSIRSQNSKGEPIIIRIGRNVKLPAAGRDHSGELFHARDKWERRFLPDPGSSPLSITGFSRVLGLLVF
jgi:hypothetical protein